MSGRGSVGAVGVAIHVHPPAADCPNVEFPSLARRILVVDDDATRTATLVGVLDGAGRNWQIETAISGRVAMAA